MGYLGRPASRAIDMRAHLGRFAAVLGVLSVIAIAFLVFTVSEASRRRDAALVEQQHSFGVMLLARSLESTLTRSEASLGHYVLSGDVQVGRFYYSEWRRAGGIMTRLERETADDPAQQALLRSLRSTYDRRGIELSDAALRTNYGQNWNAIGKYYQAARSPSLARMSATLQQLIDAERTTLRDRSRAAGLLVGQSNRTAFRLSLFGTLLILGAGVLAWLTARAVGQRRIADEDNEATSQRADVLEDAVATRTAELREALEQLRAETSERAAAEEQLRQVQKMEAVGKLTGGIAHDFNNMLAVVTGGLELARRRLRDQPEDACRQIDRAMEGATRAAALTRRLLAFSRAEPLLPAGHDPAVVIAAMTDLLDRTLGERILLRTRLDGGGWPVWVDRHQFENAVLNLAVNARDAMAGEGTITIATANRWIGPGEASVASGDYLAVSVADEGCGIAPELIDRITEPFFTTKPVGEGTGLGLPQVFAFARQSGGELAIASRPGAGTTVTILLPRHRGAVENAAPAAADRAAILPSPPAAGGGRRILVVEDDPRVIAATVDALRELGHRPLPCPDPADAQRMVASNPDVSLILSDVVMPGISGPDLVAQLTRLRPDVAVLFVTGFTGEADEADFGGHQVLRKPFTIAGLERAIGAALDRAGPDAVAA